MALKRNRPAQLPIPPAAASGTYLRSPVREVLRSPDPRLKLPARTVHPCDADVVRLSRVLVATMRAAPACVGLAATQVGENMRAFAMDVSGHRHARSCAGLVVLVNPRIVARSPDVILREGCLSVPDQTGNVGRAAEVTVEGFEPGSGRHLRFDADGIEARCIQHEIDHLDGYLFVDRVRDAAMDLFERKRYA